MVRQSLGRLRELYEEDGITGIAAGVRRFLWWQCGGRELQYSFHRLTGRPVSRRIGSQRARFRVGSNDEFKRIRSLSGEEEPLEWFLDQARPTDVVWDVGANVGVYSVFAARTADAVVAFEPHPANVDRLRENASLNDVDVDVRSVALSDAEATGALEVGEHEAGAGGGRVADDGAYEVDLVVGDGVEPTPDVVKIDVEGHERAVLDGMSESLAAVRTLLVEVHDEDDVAAVRDLLESHVFDVERRWSIGTRSFLTATEPDSDAR